MVAEALIREKNALALAEQTDKEKKIALAQTKEAIKNLKNKGLSSAEIATIFNCSEEHINGLI